MEKSPHLTKGHVWYQAEDYHEHYFAHIDNANNAPEVVCEFIVRFPLQLIEANYLGGLGFI